VILLIGWLLIFSGVTQAFLGLAGLTLAIGLFFFAQGALDLVAYFSTASPVD
jgi:hypothetical protein